MDSKKFEDYLANRYSEQIDWYEEKALKNKEIYTIFQWGVIILSALIPVLIVILEDDLKWLTAALGVILAIGTAGLKSFKFQENWINYRTIAETLKKEQYFYDAKLERYADAADQEALFVERVEALISRENSLWISIQQLNEERQDEQTAT